MKRHKQAVFYKWLRNMKKKFNFLVIKEMQINYVEMDAIFFRL